MRRRLHVSIHAPARGATIGKTAGSFGAGVSIHAPARGATRRPRQTRRRRNSFNPRAREGRDRYTKFYKVQFVVSIHAPARGATYATTVYVDGNLVSIHAPARGATQSGDIAPCQHIVSIHAPARGATPSQPPARAKTAVSIHAPARGATEYDLETGQLV